MCERDFQLSLVLSTIAGGCYSIEEIAHKCDGLYPLELRTLLDELVRRGQVSRLNESYDLASFQKGKSGLRQAGLTQDWTQLPELPVPHPHDYDWRFDNRTSQHLAQIAINETLPNATALLLGTPSVLIEMARFRNPPPTILLDGNNALVDYLARFQLPSSFILINHNLLSGSLWKADYPVDIVLCDPPWYPEYYTAFLAQATHAARAGATIVVCLLPINTRPSAGTDRWEILKTAHYLGLHLQAMEPGAIRYQTPSFESASLRSSGLKITSNWRSGDIAVFRKISDPGQEVIEDLLASSAEGDDEGWAEVLLGRYKIKLRGPFDDYETPPELISIEKGDILPTVSRRYKGRALVDLWLWDNRVFGVKGKAAFWAALQTLAGRPQSYNRSPITEEDHHCALELLQQVIGVFAFSHTESGTMASDN